MGTMANSEDPDEMQHKAAIHQDLHCLLRQIRSSEKEIQFGGGGGLLPATPHNIQWTILTLYLALGKIPLVFKGLTLKAPRKKNTSENVVC